jgi:hypothetical protein
MRYGRGIVFTMLMTAVVLGLVAGGIYHQPLAYVAGAFEGLGFGFIFGGLLGSAARLGWSRMWFHDLLASIVMIIVTMVLGCVILHIPFKLFEASDIVDTLFLSRPMPANWQEFFRIRITRRPD